MNWVWPMAPAQLPVIFSGVVSPRARMRSASVSCCSKNWPRRPSKARVASDRITERSPRRVP